MADLDSDLEVEIDKLVAQMHAAQVARYERKAAHNVVLGKLPTETAPDLWEFVARLNSAGLLSPVVSMVFEEYGGEQQVFLSKLDTLQFVEILRLVRLHASIWQ